MADYHRYQPRRSRGAAGHGGRWVFVIIALIIIYFIGRAIFSGHSDTNDNNNSPSVDDITLLNNNSGVDLNANSASLANSNTNTSAVTVGGSWANFSVKACPTAISQFGTKKQVVLTFGLSAANDQAQQAIDALKATNAPADFFVSGTFAAAHQELVKSIAAAGYGVYSQSYDSTNMINMTAAEATAAITKAETAIQTAAGASPKPIFRPPAGSYTTDTVKLLNESGYCTVLWTVDAYDWQDGMTADQSKQRVMDKVRAGAIVALHAGYDITPTLVTNLISDLKGQGYELVNLATLLNTP